MSYVKTKQATLFTQTATATVANTTTETTLIAAGEGTTTINKNCFAVGKTFRIKASGVYSNTGTPTLNVKVNVGAVTVLTTGAITTVTGASNRMFTIEGIITVRSIGSSGTLFGQGLAAEVATSGTTLTWPMSNTSTAAVDTTANKAIDITVTWGAASASNTISCTNVLLEELN